VGAGSLAGGARADSARDVGRHGGGRPRRLCGVFEWQGGRVEPLLERCWPSIVEVAQQLLRVGEARQQDVCVALGLTDRGGPGSVELALMRSGNFPRAFKVIKAEG
jgi:hypothetical protein